MTMSTRPLEELRLIRIPPPLLEVHAGQGLPAHGVLGHGVRDALGVEQVRVVRQVVDVVADLVVVDVVRHARLAAEEQRLLLCLELLGTGEDAARGDSVLDEGGVVGAAGPNFGYVGGAVGLVEELKLLLDFGGTGGPGEVEGAAIAIVDTVDVVRAGDLHHVRLAIS